MVMKGYKRYAFMKDPENRNADTKVSSPVNPFTLTFGREPVSLISREQDSAEILEGFRQDPPDCQALMITGVRGSGKTVMLTGISNELRQQKDWIVVDLNPERDMLQMLAAELSNRPALGQLFKDASINLSFLGFGLNIDGEPPITDITVALDRMLSVLTKRGKRLLITIDEVTSTPRMREFAAQFQICLRKNYHIFLLMTGLYENINRLQNEKTLTFLYRTPRIEMAPLSTVMIAEKYAEVFHLTEKDALGMAKMTNGYAYAFQLLGYLCFKKNKPFRDVLSEYDANLEQYVYGKIWSELSETDQKILQAMASTDETKVEKIREAVGINSGSFSVYRDRLIKKGLIRPTRYAHVEFSLPRFGEFVRRTAAY